MKLTIGKTAFEVSPSYLLAALSMLAAIALPLGIILFAVVPNAGMAGDVSFEAYYSAITGIVSVIAGPLIAGAFVVGLGLFKMEKDAFSCASMAASGFAVYAVIIVAIFVFASTSVPATAAMDALGAISTLIQAAAGAIVIYLWMRMFTKFDGARLGAVLPFAIAFAVIVFLGGRLFLYALASFGGPQFQFALDLAAAGIIATWLLNGAAILYGIEGRPLDMDAAYIYAAFILADGVIYGVVDGNLAILGNLSRFVVLAEALVALAVLYILSRKTDLLKSFKGMWY